MLGIFFNHSPPRAHGIQLDSLTNEFQGSACFLLPSGGIADTCLSVLVFYAGTGDLNFRACTVGVLLTEPSLKQSLLFYCQGDIGASVDSNIAGNLQHQIASD